MLFKDGSVYEIVMSNGMVFTNCEILEVDETSIDISFDGVAIRRNAVLNKSQICSVECLDSIPFNADDYKELL